MEGDHAVVEGFFGGNAARSWPSAVREWRIVHRRPFIVYEKSSLMHRLVSGGPFSAQRAAGYGRPYDIACSDIK